MSERKATIGDKWDAFSDRIGQVEKTQVEQGAELLYIRSQLGSVDTTLKTLVNEIGHSRQTNWSTIAAWFTVILTILGGLSYSLYLFADAKIQAEKERISVNQLDIKDLQEWQRDTLTNQFTSKHGEKLEKRLLTIIEQNRLEIREIRER